MRNLSNTLQTIFGLLLSYIKKKPVRSPKELFVFIPIQGYKVDLNSSGPISTDMVGANWDYPDADKAKRKEIIEAHKNYTQGLIYFVGNDPRVPDHIRGQMKGWGLCKDEFKDNDHWPPQLYVREARRMLGEYVLTEKDVLHERNKSDSVVVAQAPIESHHVQRIVDAKGFAENEGFLYQKREEAQPFAVPYRALTPKRSECKNLLVPVALSASHIAYSSVRMEPTYMSLGQSAALAASVAIESSADTPGISIQDISLSSLRKKLDKHKVIYQHASLNDQK